MTTPAPPTLNPSEVQVGTADGPGLYLAPAGTEPPDIGEDWEDPWRVLGYLSDDGPTIGTSTDSEQLIPWQSVVPIRDVITGRSITMQFVLWQLNQLTLALYFDQDEPVPEDDGAIDMELRSDAPAHLYAVGIGSRDAERTFIIAFGRAGLSAAGDMQITRGAAVPLDCTMSALDDGGLLGWVRLSGLGDDGNGAASLSASARKARRQAAEPATAGV